MNLSAQFDMHRCVESSPPPRQCTQSSPQMSSCPLAIFPPASLPQTITYLLFSPVDQPAFSRWFSHSMCPPVCDSMDYSPPGSSVHEISQATILEWVSISFSRDLLDPGIKHGSPVLQADS